MTFCGSVHICSNDEGPPEVDVPDMLESEAEAELG